MAPIRDFIQAGLEAGRLQRYGVALAAVAVASLLRLLLDPLLGLHMVYAVLLVGVIVAAWYGGAGPGVFATALSLAVAAWFIPVMGPDDRALDLQSLTRAGLFIATSGVAVAVGAASRNLRREAILRAQQILERESTFHALADNMAQLAWMADPDGRIFWYNRRWYEYTGTRPEGTGRFRWADFHHPDHAVRTAETLGASVRTGTPWEDTFPLRGTDGRYRWFLSRAFPIRGPDGRVTRWFGTSTDIHDQRDAQEALQVATAEAQRQAAEAEERQRILSAMMEHIPIGITLASGPQVQIRAVSRHAEHLLQGLINQRAGSTLDERASQGDLLRPDGTPIPPESWPLGRTARGETVRDEECVIALPDGRRIAVLCNGAPVRSEHGDILCGVLAWQDISERKRIENDLRVLNENLEQRIAERTREAEQRAAQLRKLNADLVQTEQRERRQLAQVLHDGIQQLLAAAKMRADNLAAHADEPARRELQKIDDLLAQCLDASRVLTVELFPPVLHDRGLIPALHWLARHMHDKYGLTVDVSAPEDAQPDDEENGVLLFQTARELLFNVFKHAGTPRAAVALSRAGNRLTLEVSDLGRGLDPAQISIPSPDIGGLGLFSIRERFELLGGTCEIDSAPGAGATIRVQLTEDWPAERDVEPTSGGMMDGQAPAVAPGSVVRVLLVDDHEIVREGLANLLGEQPDIEVIGEAADGLAAIVMVERLHPDVIVMDVSMPRLDGIEATRRIVAANPRVCVIGLSMHEHDDVARALQVAGAAAYLVKDSASRALVSTIRRCIAGSRSPAAGSPERSD
jgi:PAS domain S-box-containing protein